MNLPNQDTALPAASPFLASLGARVVAAADGPLRALGHCAQASRTLVFCDAQIVDAQGELVARVQGTFKLLRRADFARR